MKKNDLSPSKTEKISVRTLNESFYIIPRKKKLSMQEWNVNNLDFFGIYLYCSLHVFKLAL